VLKQSAFKNSDTPSACLQSGHAT